MRGLCSSLLTYADLRITPVTGRMYLLCRNASYGRPTRNSSTALEKTYRIARADGCAADFARSRAEQGSAHKKATLRKLEKLRNRTCGEGPCRPNRDDVGSSRRVGKLPWPFSPPSLLPLSRPLSLPLDLVAAVCSFQPPCTLPNGIRPPITGSSYLYVPSSAGYKVARYFFQLPRLSNP